MATERVGEKFNGDDAIPVGYVLVGVAVSTLFFQLLNVLVQWFGSPSSVCGVKAFWKWRNLLVSWVHAVIVGTWTLTCFYKYPELTGDLVGYYNSYLYGMVAFSTGYFVYDFINIVHGGYTLSSWEVVIHHVLVATMFIANMLLHQCVAYTAVALLAEVNTIFLHARKLLQMLHVPFNSWIYRANAAANMATFVCCRFVCLVWITYGIIMYHDIIGPRYYLAISSSTFVMSIINIVLFWRLLCSDYLRTQTRKELRGATAPSVSPSNGVSHSQLSATSVNGSEVGMLNGHGIRRRDITCRADSSAVIADISERVGKCLTVESHLPDFEGLMYYHSAEASHMAGMHLDFDGVIG